MLARTHTHILGLGLGYPNPNIHTHTHTHTHTPHTHTHTHTHMLCTRRLPCPDALTPQPSTRPAPCYCWHRFCITLAQPHTTAKPAGAWLLSAEPWPYACSPPYLVWRSCVFFLTIITQSLHAHCSCRLARRTMLRTTWLDLSLWSCAVYQLCFHWIPAVATRTMHVTARGTSQHPS
jgi:hypothetical protein